MAGWEEEVEMVSTLVHEKWPFIPKEEISSFYAGLGRMGRVVTQSEGSIRVAVWLLERVLAHGGGFVDIPVKATLLRHGERLYVPRDPPSRFLARDLREGADIHLGSSPNTILVATSGEPFETWTVANRYNRLLGEDLVDSV